MKVMKSAQILMAVGVLFSAAAASQGSVHPLVQQARIKAAAGDREGAAALYRRVLEEDANNANNMRVRKELAKLLIEAKVDAPDTEEEELEAWYLETHAKPRENLQ